jgi:hypothetical protein
MPGALQSNQQLLDLVELDMVVRLTGDVVGKGVVSRSDIGHVVLLGQLANVGRSSAMRVRGHGFSVT